jgi:hypothetical protein
VIFQIFDFFIGRIVRMIQLTLSPPSQAPIYSVTQNVKVDAIKSSTEYALKNMNRAMMFQDRRELWKFCALESKKIIDAHIVLEFGVWKGESINYFAELLPHLQIFGFDSFKGLEENWTGTNLSKEHFTLNGAVPKHSKNVTLICGWFEETLPNFVKSIQNEKIKILHMDADTYKPTKYVLRMLSGNLFQGSIIIFDEYFGYPNWKSHEFLAFQEFVTENKLDYEYLAYGDNQVAVKLL